MDNYLEREEKKGTVETKQEQANIPLGMVSAPRFGYIHQGRDRSPAWINAMDNWSKRTGALADKIEREDRMKGKMLQMQGKTWEELEDNMESKATMQGFATMDVARNVSNWNAEHLEKIKRGKYAHIDPEEFTGMLQEEFSASLTGNRFTDNLVTGLAEKLLPEMASAQLVSNSAWREQETYNSYVDTLVQASHNGEEDVLSFADPYSNEPVLNGLSLGRRRQALTEAVTRAYKEGSNVLGKSLGLQSGGDPRAIEYNSGSSKIIDGFSKPLKVKIRKIAEEVGIPPMLLAKLVATESGGVHESTSPKGAIGYTQLMEPAAREMKVDRYDPEDNLRGGARYLKKQLDDFDGNLQHALMAYNWGPGNTRKWLDGTSKKPIPKETRDYVSKMTGGYLDDSGSFSHGTKYALKHMGFTSEQQSSMYKARDSFIESQKNSWSMGTQLAIDSLIEAYEGGEVTYEEVLGTIKDMNLAQGLEQSTMTKVTSIRNARIQNDMELATRVTPEIKNIVSTVVDDIMKIGYTADEGAFALRDVLYSYGITNPKDQDASVEYLYKQYNAKQEAESKMLDGLLEVSPEVHQQLQNAFENISNDPATLTDAKEVMEAIFDEHGVPDKARIDYTKEAEKLFKEKTKAGQPVQDIHFSPYELGAIRSLKDKINSALQEPNADFTAVLVEAKATVEKELAEKYGWNQAKIDATYKQIHSEVESAWEGVIKKNVSMATEYHNKRARIRETEALFKNGSLAKASSKDQKLWIDDALSRVSAHVQENLEGATDEEVMFYTASECGYLLGEVAKQGVTDSRHKGIFDTLLANPPVDETGNITNPSYMANLIMAESLIESAPQESATFMSKDAHAFVSHVMKMSKGDPALMEESALAALASMSPERKDARKLVSARVDNKELYKDIESSIEDAIESIYPGWFDRLFSGNNVTVPRRGLSTADIKRLSTDYAVVEEIKADVIDIMSMNSSISMDTAIETAVARKLSSGSVIAGNLVEGSPRGLLADMGVDGGSPQTAEIAFHMYINEMGLITKDMYKDFGDGTINKPRQLTNEERDSLDPVDIGNEPMWISPWKNVPLSENMSYDIQYNKDTHQFLVKMYTEEGGRYREQYLTSISAKTLGDYYKDKRRAREDKIMESKKRIRKAWIASSQMHTNY